MLLDISNQLKMIVKKLDNIKLDDNKLNMLEKILIKYNNSILPVDVVKDNLRLNYENTNKLLMELAKNNILELNYKIWCDSSVTNPDEHIYRDFLDIPMETCENCEKKCRILNNVVIVYRVRLNE